MRDETRRPACRLPLSAVAATLAFVAGCAPKPVETPAPVALPTPATVAASPTPMPVVATPPTPMPVVATPPTPRAPLPVFRLRYVPPPRGKSVIAVPRQIPNSPADFLHVPKGYRVTLAASGLTHPRTLAVAPNGDLFVVESRLETKAKEQPNRVLVLTDRHSDGAYRTRHIWADKLYLPFGIAFSGDFLYVANTGSVVRWQYRTGDTSANAAPETVITGIPERGMRQHWTRNILFAPTENRLYLTVGSKENADIEEPLRGTIVAYNLDATGKPTGAPKIVASGMRNPVGLALYPRTGKLWAVVNERDYLGDNLVPDFLTRVTEGGFYGWPFYFIGANRDPRLPPRPDLQAKVLLPDTLLGSHGAPIGLVFTADGSAALVARHGSQNRARKIGYDVVRVRFDKNGVAEQSCTPLVTGWLPNPKGEGCYGRPAGLAWDMDGSLLIADDWGGRIWRVAAKNGWDE